MSRIADERRQERELEQKRKQREKEKRKDERDKRRRIRIYERKDYVIIKWTFNIYTKNFKYFFKKQKMYVFVSDQLTT